MIHFAALAYVGESMSRPLAYYRINVAGLVNVLEAMLRHGTPTIVFSSSCPTFQANCRSWRARRSAQPTLMGVRSSQASRSSPMHAPRKVYASPCCAISTPPADPGGIGRAPQPGNSPDPACPRHMQRPGMGPASLQAKVDEALIQSGVGLRERLRGKFARPAGRVCSQGDDAGRTTLHRLPQPSGDGEG